MGHVIYNIFAYFSFFLHLRKILRGLESLKNPIKLCEYFMTLIARTRQNGNTYVVCRFKTTKLRKQFRNVQHCMHINYRDSHKRIILIYIQVELQSQNNLERSINNTLLIRLTTSLY